MENTNPYQAPNAQVSAPKTETYQPKIFSTQGRIGRLRYLAYCFASYLILIPFIIIGVIVASVMGADSETYASITGIATITAYIPMMIFFFIIAKRRLNDMNQSGWLSLTILIPLVNIFIGLWLLFGRGTEGQNNHGPAPIANSTGVKVTAIIMVFIPILGIIAAVSIPAYQDYVERAQQTQTP